MIGHVLLETCDRLPVTRPMLRKLGMRTSQEWFRDEVVTVHLDNGQVLRLGSISENYLSFELFWKGVGYYEPITTLVARQLAAGSAVFLDVGANIGFYSLVLGIHHPHLQIVAFEPNPKNYRLLRANVELNALKVRCEPLALSDREGTGSLFVSESDMSASLESDFEESVARLQVARTSLDAFLAGRSFSGRMLIKVDVEGHEEAFFRGAVETLKRHQPDLIVEVTHTENPAVVTALQALGYRFYSINDQGLTPAPQLKLVVRDQFVFLNYLVSARPPGEVAAVFEGIRARVEGLDLTKTSKCVSPDLLQRMQSRAREK